MTVKDSFDVAGLHTTWGNPAFKDHVAAADATVVRRLRAAGAVVVGTTNVAFMLGDFGQTANELHGVTGNPWDLARSPGGSSGGAAAAVAAGLSFLEYGSDLVGSIRLPASYCGVSGPASGSSP
jgi:amidase